VQHSQRGPESGLHRRPRPPQATLGLLRHQGHPGKPNLLEEITIAYHDNVLRLNLDGMSKKEIKDQIRKGNKTRAQIEPRLKCFCQSTRIVTKPVVDQAANSCAAVTLILLPCGDAISFSSPRLSCLSSTCLSLLPLPSLPAPPPTPRRMAHAALPADLCFPPGGDVLCDGVMMGAFDPAAGSDEDDGADEENEAEAEAESDDEAEFRAAMARHQGVVELEADAELRAGAQAEAEAGDGVEEGQSDEYEALAEMAIELPLEPEAPGEAPLAPPSPAPQPVLAETGVEADVKPELTMLGRLKAGPVPARQGEVETITIEDSDSE
jgi:hypothetical protein